MSLIVILVFILFCVIAYYSFYNKNYADNQNDIIIKQLLQKGARKQENISCTITLGLSIKSEPFDIYRTNHSIVLIRAYTNLVGQKRLNKQAETYLLIIKEEGLETTLFTNYIKVESLKEEKSNAIIAGDLYSKAPFSSSEFIYSSKVKIKFPITH